ncbi:uncharacterized protein PG986_001551 [Apiospora aurea]|uniref:Amidase domain-containing protein n=1 Tax=Apiospora aurea TaxID=335848 RepID=A0ABR1QXB6_9PEZI
MAPRLCWAPPCRSTRLRRASAVLLVKTNLSEWVQFRSGNTTTGWTAVGGQMSAVGVVAASIAPVSLGIETYGSIARPPSRAGLVGIKPGVVLTSRDLVVPISRDKVTVGSIARTASDAAVMLEAISGVDERDKFTDKIHTGGELHRMLPSVLAEQEIDSLATVVANDGVSEVYFLGLGNEGGRPAEKQTSRPTCWA